jgi:UPF0716 protein FxsA
MLPVIFLLLIVVPLVELAIIVQVADQIGVLETIALLIAVSVAGAWLLKQQGMATWARLQRSLAEGRMPHKEVVDGAMILFGGALLLTPGFLTDVVGLILLFPVTRAALKGAFRRLFAGWAARRFVPPGGRSVYSATVIRSRRRDQDAPPRSPHSPGEPPPLRPGEGDSPDRG